MIPQEYLMWQARAQEIFMQKNADYGNSWEELSLPSFTDLLYIKACRIRTLLLKDSVSPATGESAIYDWIALVNYATLAIRCLRKGYSSSLQEQIEKIWQEAENILERKNSDYGSAWQHIRPLAYIEFILMKIARIRSLDTAPEKNAALIEDNLFDIINYAFLYLARYGSTVPSS
ncbi:MAG: DUF1599 domain-containing protein [Bacteroidia bacterium]|nr:DUF1599 domain-containing protein [Bacteroidia bacterium]MDW8134511.1 DUF1599 domain-containing protein [Bacteroidia bacterium]